MTKKKLNCVMAIGLALVVCGCSWHARKLLKVEEKISERVKENVQIADEALDAQPPLHRTRQTDIASQAVHDAAVLTGYPLEDQKPFVALLLSDNAKLRKDAEEAWAAKRKSDQQLRTIQMHQLRELQTLGQQAEEAQNKSVVHKMWTGFKVFFGVGLVGGIIYLLVITGAIFVIGPPILGWLYSTAVRIFPKLAGWLKVVGVDAFDAVVKANQKAKDQNPAVKVVLDNELSKTMDASHKDLVLERKVAIADQDLQAAKKKADVAAVIDKKVEETETITKAAPFKP